ncbi:MAG TPA: cation:proton antiporter [Kiritimatiellia bacterium]|nr:cation:proton antiporter [Kiritimatiellia bacterium]
MSGVSFLQDLAIVMMVAGMVTLLFHCLKQPVVLGYLLAGFIISPFTPPFPLVRDEDTIRTMADLGVVFLMFSLGMDFNLRKLRQVGLAALFVAAFEILIMIFAGYLMGSAFGWSKADCIFLGVILALTSTMIVVKSLRDRGEMHAKHTQLITGISLFDDIFVILLMVALPGFARTGSLPTLDLLLMLSGLFVFLVAAVILGLLVVPRLLRYIARHATDETLLIVSLGLCFGLALFAVKLEFSAALGAFLIGAVVAESRDVGRVAALTAPIRDMFVAVFFVAIGMQINPAHLAGSLIPAVLICAGYIVVKVLACAVGAFLIGTDAKTSMRVGTNMAQLGEFAFILATLGTHFKLTSEFLYPLVVTIACLNALVRPYLVDNSERLARGLASLLPGPLVNQLSFFRRRAADLGVHRPKKSAMRHVWSLVIQLVLNIALIAGGFLAAGYVNKAFPHLFSFLPNITGGSHSLVWLGTVVILLPVYIATFRKMQALAMMLTELMTGGAPDRRTQRVFRAALDGVLLAVQVLFLLVVTLIVSAALLPPWQTLIILLLLLGGLVFRYGRAFNRWYSQGKFALIATFQEPEPPPPETPRIKHLSEAHLRKALVNPGPLAGKLIRELQLRTTTGASIIALERDGAPIVNPGPDIELLAGDEVLLLGTSAQLAAATAVFDQGVES